MHRNLKDRLAIATGALSAAAVPLGADAGIIYKDINHLFAVNYNGTTIYEWDVDGTGGSEFVLRTFKGSTYAYINLDSAGRNARGMVGNGSEANFRYLRSGFVVGPTLAAYAWGPPGVNYRSVMVSSGRGGDFSPGRSGNSFIGFRFLSGAATLYAWAEINLANIDGGTVTVKRWAYESTPDCQIAVGQTSGANCTQVPAPPTLALLAVGALGIRRWRRTRAAA